DPGEQVLALVTLGEDAPPPALGTAAGVVKRVTPGDVPAEGDVWEAISLKDGDDVEGAATSADDDELLLVSSDAQLSHFSPSPVRPQGRAAGGMAGIKLAAGSRAVFFGVVPAAAVESAVVASVAGSSSALPGTEAGTGKVTPFAAYPGKGRATGGVRVQRFLK